jgi:peptide-methionine (S)-S-oxide reductase
MRTLIPAIRTALVAVAMAVGLAALPGVAQTPDKSPATGPGAGKPANLEIATFAGGCFWCVEYDFDKVEGVVSTTSGFMGGKTPNPTYKQVTSGGTGHIEVVQIAFDPAKVSYSKLVEHFWRTVDPYDAGGQFCDRGESYTTAIFAHSPAQKAIAEKSRANLVANGPLKQPVATTIRDSGPFTAAEAYHQDFYTKNPLRYKFYRNGCGRDQRLAVIWGSKAGH